MIYLIRSTPCGRLFLYAALDCIFNNIIVRSARLFQNLGHTKENSRGVFNMKKEDVFNKTSKEILAPALNELCACGFYAKHNVMGSGGCIFLRGTGI